ncbi:MAG: hypothetical protein IKC05_06075, partial [Lentisphaeria bacterium]|nr:hypothetical protein [Lentisphaeria bacterium]
MKQFSILFSLLAAVMVTGADLILVDKGKSAYSIVIPQNADRWSSDSAKLLAEGIFRSAKVRLPIIKESLYKNTPAIFIGDVKALGKKPELKIAEHRIEVKGKNVFIYGRNATWGSSMHFSREQGDAIAVAAFLRNFCGAEMLFPGKGFEGLSVISRTKITVPENYSFVNVPVVSFNIGRHHGLYYDVFNGHFTAPW